MIESITRQLASRSEVQATYLVRKKVQTLTNRPSCALIVIPHHTWHELDTEGHNPALLSCLSEGLTLPEDTSILVAGQLMKHQ